MPTTAQAAAAPRGRPPSHAAHQAVLRAVLEVAAAQGYPGCTLDAVAAAAGVPKSTIYRRWRSKGELLAAALLDRARALIPLSNSGSLERDLTLFLAETFAAGGTPGVGEILRGLVAEAQQDSSAAQALRDSLVAARRAELTALLKRGRKRGELPARSRLDLAVDMVFGAFWYRLLITRLPLDRRYAGMLARAVLASCRGR